MWPSPHFMAFVSTVDCCGSTRLARLKAILGALQNLSGANPANDPALNDTWHGTLEKIARAAGRSFSNCCRLETRKTLQNLILGIVIPPDSGGGGSTVPDNAILDENGNPILDEDGNYILYD